MAPVAAKLAANDRLLRKQAAVMGKIAQQG
jgi:hypothetical protein